MKPSKKLKKRGAIKELEEIGSELLMHCLELSERIEVLKERNTVLEEWVLSIIDDPDIPKHIRLSSKFILSNQVEEE